MFPPGLNALDEQRAKVGELCATGGETEKIAVFVRLPWETDEPMENFFSLPVNFSFCLRASSPELALGIYKISSGIIPIIKALQFEKL